MFMTSRKGVLAQYYDKRVEGGFVLTGIYVAHHRALLWLQGLTFHETEDYTVYPAPILSVTRQRFTKHYYIGDRRVASKIGAGIFQNAYGHGANVVTAGQKDYQMRMIQIERQREDYYRKLGTPPGVPTMKGQRPFPTTQVMATTPSSESWATTLCPKVGYNVRSSTTREMSLVHPFNGRNPKTLTMRSRATAMSLPTPPTTRKSSITTPTTSAAPLISPTPRPTSPRSMLTYPMASCSLMNTRLRRRCRISSTARSLTKRRDYITTGRDI